MHSIIRLSLLVAFIVALSYFPASADSHEMAYTRIIKNASPVYNYVIVSGRKSANIIKAHKMCERIHGSLADITFDNTIILSGALGDASPAWVRSWNGDDYGKMACIALYHNGVIAVPPGTCKDRHSFICQVSKKTNVCSHHKCHSEDEKESEERDWEPYHHNCRKYRNKRSEESHEEHEHGHKDHKDRKDRKAR